MFDIFDSNSRGWLVRMMEEDVEVEGMVVEVEGTVVEVDVEIVSAIVRPWDRACSDTMKRFELSQWDYNNELARKKQSVCSERKEEKIEKENLERKREWRKKKLLE